MVHPGSAFVSARERSVTSLVRLAPAAGDRQAAVAPEVLVADLRAWGVPATLPLRTVDQADDPFDLGRVEPCGDDVADALVTVDVALQDRVENLVVGQRVGVELSRSQFRRGRFADRRLGDRWPLATADGISIAPAGERPHQGLGDVLDRPEAADGVAVDRRVPDRELALVPRREHQVT